MFPPNYKAVNAAFNVRGRQVIFCYGDVIYNPSRVKIGDELIAHEKVHSGRQNGDPVKWWERYIGEPQFRLDEEIPAHRAELAISGDLQGVAHKLSSPLYGSLISFDRAAQILAGCA